MADAWVVAVRDRAALARAVKSACERLGFDTELLWATKVRTSNGRLLQLLHPNDAHALYLATHHHPVVVIEIGEVMVRLNPRRSDPRNAISVSRYVKYKAWHDRIGRSQDEAAVNGIVKHFRDWAGSTRCNGDPDPRCLPLHVFRIEGSYALDDSAERERFATNYGSPSRRTASNGIIWERSLAYHAIRDQLTVAGCVITPGFHWDVHPGRGTGKVSNSREVWEIGRRGYVNIYPNAHVRDGENARKAWSASGYEKAPP